MDSSILALKYHEALVELDPSFFDPKHPESKKDLGLSGFFLPSIPEGYSRAKNRIMVVGRETRGWYVLKEEAYVDLDDYISKAMKVHKKFFSDELSASNTKGNAFLNFIRKVAYKSGSEGLLYSNLLCCSWNKSFAEKYTGFNLIKDVSEKILKAQIELLKPDVIIFANGVTTNNYRNEFFPVRGEAKVCYNGHDFSDQGIPKNQLWGFDLKVGIRCYRIHHPSCYSKEASLARDFVVNLLPDRT